MKTSILSVMAFAMMLSLQSACGEGTGGSGPETSSSLPKVEGFQLEGERWTCTADGKPLGGILFKPADLPRPPARSCRSVDPFPNLLSLQGRAQRG